MLFRQKTKHQTFIIHVNIVSFKLCLVLLSMWKNEINKTEYFGIDMAPKLLIDLHWAIFTDTVAESFRFQGEFLTGQSPFNPPPSRQLPVVC